MKISWIFVIVALATGMLVESMDNTILAIVLGIVGFLIAVMADKLLSKPDNQTRRD